MTRSAEHVGAGDVTGQPFEDAGMTNELRAKFEAYFSQPPFEWKFGRYTDKQAWPGAYVHYHIECAWESWQACHAALQAVAPPQAAGDKVVVIRDGQATTEGLVLAAAIYMGAVKDIFSLRSDGPPYNERKVTKDAGALRAFNHLDAATKALRQAISHFAPTDEPIEPPKASAVPDARPDLDPVEMNRQGIFVSDSERAYNDGWNDCRDAILSAAPQPKVQL